MINNENIYQSILQELSQIPSTYLPIVDNMLELGCTIEYKKFPNFLYLI
jgi:hypothetical protein